MVLKDVFPKLYLIESHKNCKINDRINASCSTETWCWKRGPQNGEELRQLTVLNSLVASVQLSEVFDSWIWKADKNSDFSVRSMCGLMDSKITGDDRLRFY